MNKSFFLATVFVFAAGVAAQAGDSSPDSPNSAEVFAQRIHEAARVDLPYWDGKSSRIPTRYVTVTDHQWINHFAADLGSAFLEPSPHVLAIAPDVIFRGKDGTAILRLECLGRIIRVDSADYLADARSASELQALLKEKEPRSH